MVVTTGGAAGSRVAGGGSLMCICSFLFVVFPVFVCSRSRSDGLWIFPGLDSGPLYARPLKKNRDYP